MKKTANFGAALISTAGSIPEGSSIESKAREFP